MGLVPRLPLPLLPLPQRRRVEGFTPFPYQEEGADWLTSHPRSILADEMGLGKTIQVGMILEDWHRLFQRPLNVLIIAKTALAGNWKDELGDKFGLYVSDATGTTVHDVMRLRECVIVYTNYAKLRLPRFLDVILARKWDVVVVDEAHRMKGRNAQQTEGLWKLARQTDALYFLSGSPMPNGNPVEIWSWLHAIDPATYRSYWRFAERWCEFEDKGYGPKPVRARDPKEFGTWLATSGLMLRRTEDEVKGEMKQKRFHKKMRHPLSRRQAAMYKQMKKDFIISLEKEPTKMSATGSRAMKVEAPNTAARFAALRKIALTPRMFGEEDDGGKILANDAIVEEAMDAGKQVVIFTWHREFARILAERYGVLGSRFVGVRGCGIITGGISGDLAHREVGRFRSGEYPVLVGTIAGMGEGFNLQNASVVIFAELSYVPEDNAQAVKRVVGRGENHIVNIYTLVADGTHEHFVYDAVTEKKGYVTDALMMVFAFARAESGAPVEALT